MVRRDRGGAGLADASVAALDGQLEPMVMGNTQDDQPNSTVERAPDPRQWRTADARRIWTLPAFIRRGQAVGSLLSWFLGMDMDSVTDRRFSSGCGTRWG